MRPYAEMGDRVGNQPNPAGKSYSTGKCLFLMLQESEDPYRSYGVEDEFLGMAFFLHKKLCSFYRGLSSE